MKKKKVFIGLGIILIIGLAIASIILIVRKSNKIDEPKENYSNKEESPKGEEKNNDLVLNEDLKFEINEELTVLSLINENNTLEVLNQEEAIDTSSLGEKEVTIKYKDDKDDKEQVVNISIVDTISPTIEYKKELSTTKGTKIDLLKDVKVSDNSKEEIKATVDGSYDFNKEGTYKLKYVASDSSNNKVEEEFTLTVKKKTTNTNTNTNTNKQTNTNTNNNKTTNNNSVEEDEPCDEEYDKTIYLGHKNVTSSSVEVFIDTGATEATGFELYLYSDEGSLLKTYEFNNTRSFKVTGLKYNTSYGFHAKGYVLENGNKKYVAETNQFGNRSTYMGIRTDRDDKMYENEMFEIINSKNNNQYKRDTKLDEVARTCAKMYYDEKMSTGSSNIKAEDCLNKHGITDVKSSSFNHVDYFGRACVVGTNSCGEYFFSYVPISDISNIYWGNHYKYYPHIGVAYYKNIASIISVKYNSD